MTPADYYDAAGAPDPDAAALQAEDRHQRQQAARLARHPDCRDPDHPDDDD